MTNGRSTDDLGKKCNSEFDKKLELFLQSGWGRFGRAFEYDFERLEQPKVVVTGSGTITPNPEYYLNEHTIKFQFSELFPTSSTVADAVKSTCALMKRPLDECLPEHRGLDWGVSGRGVLRRFFSGLTLNVDLSERQAFVQGLPVPSPSFTQHYQVTGGFDLDPTQLFLSGSNWGKAYDALCSKWPVEAASPADCSAKKKVYEICEGKAPDPEKCIKDLSSPRLFPGREGSLIPRRNAWTVLLAAIVPTVSFKRVSQLDFLKSGGFLAPTSLLQNGLNQFTLKWDLKKAIASSASRTALMPVQNNDQQGLPPKETKQQDTRQQEGMGKLCVIVSGATSSYINVPAAFAAESCAAFAASTGARALLGCVTSKGISVGSGPPLAMSGDNDSESCWKANSTASVAALRTQN